MTASAPSDDRDRTRQRALAGWLLARIVLLVALGIASLVFVKLALPAVLLVFIGWASLPRDLAPNGRRTALALLAVASIATAVGCVRFVLLEAAPGIIAGGKRASSKAIVSKLRQVVVAQDAMRRNGLNDPDEDGVGSAALIAQLTGQQPLSDGKHLRTPVLSPRQYGDAIDTEVGPAAQLGGYLVMACVPARGGGWVTRPGEAVDAEAAERRWVAYAWPARESNRLSEAYFIDEHERILVSDNRAADGASDLRYLGWGRPPPCDAALGEAARTSWKPWQGKQPRAELPGDR